LNLIERLWKFVKKQCLYSKYYTDFSAFTSAIEDCLVHTQTTHKQALSSLLTLHSPQKNSPSLIFGRFSDNRVERHFRQCSPVVILEPMSSILREDSTP
jgi:hypothetical protein